jgi:hypothetical protein
MVERRAPGSKPRPAESDAPTTAESWERHKRIAELVQRIRRTRALRLSPGPPRPRER